MKILITNRALAIPEGSETAVYTLALELKGCGHEVMVYSPRTGQVSQKLVDKGVYVGAAVSLFGGQPDIIHVHHRECLRTVQDVYPNVPKVWVSNGMVGEENPHELEEFIDTYVAVSEEVKEHLLATCDTFSEDITVINNGVNCARFAPASVINEEPERIAVLSNRFNAGAFDDNEKKARQLPHCLDIPIIGKLAGGAIWNVEREILKYDVIATAGRGAMEAMAAGRAVIAMGPHGIDGMIRPRTWRHYIRRNFSGRTKRIKANRDNLLAELRHYDRKLGAWGRSLAIDNFNIRNQADKYIQVYRLAWFTRKMAEGLSPSEAKEKLPF